MQQAGLCLRVAGVVESRCCVWCVWESTTGQRRQRWLLAYTAQSDRMYAGLLLVLCLCISQVFGAAGFGLCLHARAFCGVGVMCMSSEEVWCWSVLPGAVFFETRLTCASTREFFPLTR